MATRFKTAGSLDRDRRAAGRPTLAGGASDGSSAGLAVPDSESICLEAFVAAPIAT
jgi:hypothetical protein